MSALRVVIDDPDPLSRTGLRIFLVDRLGFEEVDRMAEADVVLISTDEMNAGVVERLRSLAQERRGEPEPDRPRIVIILDRVGSPDLAAAFELGVAGFVYRTQATPDHLGRVLTTVHQGGTHVPPDIQNRLVAEFVRLQRDVLAPRGLTASGLEAREVTVLRHIAEGLELTEIAERMQYSERTVKSILYSLMERLHLRNRAHAVAYAMRAGVV
ncbi:response regulator transcription factor [Kineosporia sp. J2-2]|uniref:Response regulator transcription factor n=1 Tax=Kineosporia corallincola TaxID=2835133 RepID=A0ABS5TTX6_9ACTN|nr:response regulator transcription factor [Kineosporia corallincola]MBT0774259.1 response regulator transcription factor [Kineosporia corallincola]